MKRLFVSLSRTVRHILNDDIFGRAAQTAFYLLLAFFPLGMFSLTLLGQLELRAEAGAEGVLPAEFIALLESAPAPDRTSPWLLLGSLWAASAAMWAMMKAVYRAQTGRRLRSMLGRLAALGFTLGFIVVLVLTVALMVLGRWFSIAASLLAVYVLLFLLYRYSLTPKANRILPRHAAISAALAAVMWVLATVCFELYLTRFARYTELYGGIGVFLGLALWLYIVSLVVILGAEIGTAMSQRS